MNAKNILTGGDKLGKKVGHDNDVMDKDGKLFIKKGKKLKEILGE